MKPERIVPALEYSKRIKEQGLQQREMAYGTMRTPPMISGAADTGRGRLHLAAEMGQPALERDIITNENEPQFEVYESTLKNSRDYNGPLSLGDPGLTASLWRESRGDNDIFRDHRAWKPLDLITIVISESAEGSKEADTETKSESTVEAAINQLFSFDDDIVEANPGKVDPSQLISASTTNEFKGEGETNRKDTLKARISAMVVEVLPSGILRVEGEKIIAVNQEEQVMVISGLVRQRDVNSANEVDSSKIANMRIDYYGNGIVAEAQYGGWLGRILRVVWPF